jgi:hypothetical protein
LAYGLTNHNLAHTSPSFLIAFKLETEFSTVHKTIPAPNGSGSAITDSSAETLINRAPILAVRCKADVWMAFIRSQQAQLIETLTGIDFPSMIFTVSKGERFPHEQSGRDSAKSIRLTLSRD